MSNAVQFLETLGRQPAPLSDADFVRAVMDADFDEPLRNALLQRDADGLVRALEGRSPMFCFSFIATPDGTEPAPDDDRTDEGEETPEKAPPSREPEQPI